MCASPPLALIGHFYLPCTWTCSQSNLLDTVKTQLIPSILPKWAQTCLYVTSSPQAFLVWVISFQILLVCGVSPTLTTEKFQVLVHSALTKWPKQWLATQEDALSCHHHSFEIFLLWISAYSARSAWDGSAACWWSCILSCAPFVESSCASFKIVLT